jgi:putative FmdB family regulatory protein
MVLYQYQCSEGHDSDQFADMDKRNESRPCPKCGKPAERVIAAPHVAPSGVYSYDPNTGDPQEFDRRHEEIKAKTWTA